MAVGEVVLLWLWERSYYCGFGRGDTTVAVGQVILLWLWERSY